MIIERRTYDVAIGQVPDYVANYMAKGLPVSRRHGLDLAAYFGTETGALHQVVHYWRHKSLAGRQESRAPRDADPDWRAYQAGARGRVTRQDVRLLEALAPIAPFPGPPDNGPLAIVEEVGSIVAPRDAEGYLALMRDGIAAAQAAGARPVALLRGISGETSEIVVMWAWASLAARERVMEALARDPVWAGVAARCEAMERAQTRRFLRPIAFPSA